jgi:FKBP-type peptidyl-prolyl cis-trans isomerase 2
MGVSAVNLGSGRGEGQSGDVMLVGDQTLMVEGVWGELITLDGGHKRAGEHLRCEIVENFPAGP